MNLVIDANIVFSALLKRDGNIAFLINNPNLRIYGCSHLQTEIQLHKLKLLRFISHSEQDLDSLISIIFNQITFIQEELIPFDYWYRAAALCREIDPNDTPYIALSLYLKTPLWTGDKKLRDGLLSKGFSSCISTKELQSILNL